MDASSGRILQPGLTFRGRGQCIEAVSSKVADVGLLAAGHGMEVLEGRLAQGERLTLVPSSDPLWRATEVYYLLQGVLRGELYGQPLELGAGDYLTAENLETPAIFSAQTEVRFLYFTTRPAFHEISASLSDLRRLAVEVELKDGYTADHCARLQALSYATGWSLGLPPQRLHLLEMGSYLHDVGKIKVPLEILKKPARLEGWEWEVVRRHPTFGRELLEDTYLGAAGAIVEQHHERYDGSGYPHGSRGDEVLIEAYIVAVADTYDAMTTTRPYRRALPPEAAFAELARYADVHYPGEVVRAFANAVGRVEREAVPG